jgi:hypothetical protein
MIYLSFVASSKSAFTISACFILPTPMGLIIITHDLQKEQSGFSFLPWYFLLSNYVFISYLCRTINSAKNLNQ